MVKQTLCNYCHSQRRETKLNRHRFNMGNLHICTIHPTCDVNAPPTLITFIRITLSRKSFIQNLTILSNTKGQLHFSFNVSKNPLYNT